MPTPELIAAIATKDAFDVVDKEPLDAFYLGNPYCSKISGNLISEHDDLALVIKQIKELGKKAYLSTIGVPVGDEFEICANGIRAASKAGADAVEIHDMGLLRWVMTNTPQFPVHVGFFANIYNIDTARFFMDFGAKRLLPSHELTHEECSELLGLRTEFETSIYGAIPLGYANSCMLTLDFPSREPKQCVQQCSDGTHYIQYKDWSMRSAGHALISGEDLCVIGDLPDYLGYTGLRLETLYDAPEKINKVSAAFRTAMDQAVNDPANYDGSGHTTQISRICGGRICDGWKKGISGHDFSQIDGALMMEKS